ncbi:MAG TPA: MBL fold metallo-hydrolase [Jatrophihabitans sp.]|nr:MBL fold metallo-hydrolase [Jatrophihabitans sp.]
MRLTVLGCSGSMPGPDSPASGYLVEAEGYRLVLDLGQGAFGALQRYVKPGEVDAVVVSHLHPDHCIDLTAYVVALRYGPDGYGREGAGRLPLVGPSGTRDRLAAAYDPLARKLGLHELFAFATPTDAELGPFRVSYARMNHPVATNAVRLEHDGRALVYSADTGESEELVTLATGADALLCEATMGPDEPVIPDLHLTGRQAGEHAARAGVARLIITHVPPWNSPDVEAEQAAAAFTGTIECARPAAQFDI